MKRIVIIFLILSIVFVLFAACGLDDAGAISVSGDDRNIAKLNEYGNSDSLVKYIRTQTLSGQKNTVVIIESFEELNAYYSANYFKNGNIEGNYLDLFVDFLEAVVEFDSAFFEDNFLVFVITVESSGSIRHKVNSVDFEQEYSAINIDRYSPQIGTCDMATWHIIVSIDRSKCLSKEFQVNFSDINNFPF
ncbi:MAG: hypothetical protein ACOX3U_01145 [Christensenellales bacterium]